VSVGVFSCKRRGRRERQVLKFLIHTLWTVALFELVKQIPLWEYSLHIGDRAFEGKMELRLQKLVSFARNFQILTIFLKIQ